MFYESPRFPDCIAFGAQGGPSYFTEVVAVASGFEQRNEVWQFGRLAWDVSHGVRDDSDMAQLIAFFRSMKGRAHGFRFKDHSDYTSDTGGQGILQPAYDGSNPHLQQLVKRYTPGDTPFDLRLITKPVIDSVHIFKFGVEQTTGFILDTTNGVITFADPAPDIPAETWTWTGEFDVPVRFDIDSMKVGIVNKTSSGTLLEDWQSIPVLELRQ